MEEAGYIFEVVESHVDENISGECAYCVETLAKRKAKAVSQQMTGEAMVIAADTLVSINGRILEKPANEADAFEMLDLLQGQMHTVFTGVAISHSGGMISFAESTNVYFRSLTAAEINAYIKTGEPFDKAGAYGIQGKGANLVKRIEGCFYAVMGLPMARLANEIKFLIAKK